MNNYDYIWVNYKDHQRCLLHAGSSILKPDGIQNKSLVVEIWANIVMNSNYKEELLSNNYYS